MIQPLKLNNEQVVAIKIIGKVSKADVEQVHSSIHKILNQGKKPNFYFDLEDFEGYELKGFWEDLKVDAAHLNDYGKMALVGDKKWEKWAAEATDFFTGSEVRFFELSEKEQAKNWIQQ